LNCILIVILFLSYLPPRDRVVIFRSVLQKDITNQEAYDKLALALLKSGQRDAANALINTAIAQGLISWDFYHAMFNKLALLDRDYQANWSNQTYTETLLQLLNLSEDEKRHCEAFLGIMLVFCKIMS
jgi:hypothetical protein